MEWFPSQAAYDLIKRFEGFCEEAYQDSVGVWTVGFGFTGLGIKEGVTMTQDEAETVLVERVGIVANCVNRLCVCQNQNQFDALISFTYNEGCHHLEISSLRRYLNNSQPIEAANEFSLWVYAGGKELPGLVARRAAEKALFLS